MKGKTGHSLAYCLEASCLVKIAGVELLGEPRIKLLGVFVTRSPPDPYALCELCIL